MRSARPVLTILDPLVVALAGLLTFSSIAALPLALAALATLMVCRGAGLHRSRLVLSVLEDLPSLLLAALTAVLALVAVSPVITLERRELWAAIALFGALSFVGVVLVRTALYALIHVLRRSGRLAHPVLIVGVGSIGRRLADALLTRREYGLVPVGMLDSGPRLDVRGLPLPLVGGIGDLDRVMSDLGVHDVIFAFPEPPDQDTLAMVRLCVERDRQVFVVPRFFEVIGKDRHRRTELVRDIAVMRLHRRGTHRHTRLAQRLVDILVAVFGLVALAPVLVLIAVAVRLETGPGVIFHQTRVGEGGRTFTLLKFTSLQPAAFGTDATEWNIDNDSRIGPVGSFLRRTGLDELPQLVNVLRGEMSLVGPRPERAALAEEFARERARYAERRRGPGGPSGGARVEELRAGTPPCDRARFDNSCIESRSLRDDLRIMLRRARTVGRRRPTTPPGCGSPTAASADQTQVHPSKITS